MSIDHPGFINPDPRGFLPWHPHGDRIADALERIAAALERAYPLDLRDSGLTRAWDDAEIARDPNRCEPGCIRPSLHGGDCEARVVADPLDESDHRTRHSSAGHLTWRRADLWCFVGCNCMGVWRLADLGNDYGPLTFCDCPDPVVTEAENRAGD